jgi:hypothetical protein
MGDDDIIAYKKAFSWSARWAMMVSSPTRKLFLIRLFSLGHDQLPSGFVASWKID